MGSDIATDVVVRQAEQTLKQLEASTRDIEQMEQCKQDCEAHPAMMRHVSVQGNAVAMVIRMMIPVYLRAEQTTDGDGGSVQESVRPGQRGAMSLLAIAAGGGTVPTIMFIIVYLILKKEGIL